MDSSNDVTIDIFVTNVVTTFNTSCNLNLRTIASESFNVIYRAEARKVIMKLRKPRITATIWSSGKIICHGAKSEAEAKVGARRLARRLQKLGFDVKFSAFRVVNVMAVCSVPFSVCLLDFTRNNRPITTYEPELHPAAIYRIKRLRATIQVFPNGNLTVTGPNVQNMCAAVEQVYPRLLKCHKPVEDLRGSGPLQ